jgi:5-methylcytosine-specific restriction protein A
MTRLRCLKPPLVKSNPGGWKPDAVRGSRQQRGYGAAWERLRKEIIDRDEGLCQECLRNGRVTLGTQVDHVTPKSQGGTDSPMNLELKCEPCHATKTARESQGGRGQAENEPAGRTALGPTRGFFSA